jgi:hypothetical protein
MILSIFGAVLAVAVASDVSSSDRGSKYGYGESSMLRLPSHVRGRAFGMRGPTVSWRDKNPRYGVLTGAAGIRGVQSFRSYTPAEMATIRQDQAAQGFVQGSVAPGA